MSNQQSPPVILVFSAHDPSGAAGIQADIESINRNGGRCISVITSVTAQNTREFHSILPQDIVNFSKQTELLVSDIPVNACKLGLIGSALLVDAIADILLNLDQKIPVIVDPVLHSGTGANLTDQGIIDTMNRRLLPMTTIITPNLKEAFYLTGKSNKAAAANDLIDKGCQAVLITGTEQASPRVINTLYINGKKSTDYPWERLPGTYHGSGCTLAAAISAQLARGKDIETAVQAAQDFTWHSLKYGIKLGKSQFHPNRNFYKQS